MKEKTEVKERGQTAQDYQSEGKSEAKGEGASDGMGEGASAETDGPSVMGLDECWRERK